MVRLSLIHTLVQESWCHTATFRAAKRAILGDIKWCQTCCIISTSVYLLSITKDVEKIHTTQMQRLFQFPQLQKQSQHSQATDRCHGLGLVRCTRHRMRRRSKGFPATLGRLGLTLRQDSDSLWHKIIPHGRTAGAWGFFGIFKHNFWKKRIKDKTLQSKWVWSKTHWKTKVIQKSLNTFHAATGCLGLSS